MGDNLIVYKDVRYPTAFVDKSLSDAITRFLVAHKFREVDADGLRDEMLKLVKGEKEKTVIVFSQDIVPDTVLDDPSASALIRRYLDCGGSIVWFGDIPCFYKGLNTKGDLKTLAREDIWKWGAPIILLGVMPFFGEMSARPCSVTQRGRQLGLRRTWTGLRPSSGGHVLTITEGEYLNARPYITGLKPLRWWERFARYVGLVEFRLPGGVAASFQSPTQNDAAETWRDVKLANAWFKNYCQEKPYTGFLRLWDTNYLERVLDLEELLKVVQLFAGRL